MGITTLARVKLFMRSDPLVTTDDDLINLLIEAVGNDIEEYRRRAFPLDTLGNKIYPSGVEMIALQLIAMRFNQGKILQEARKSRTLDEFTESFSMPNELQEAEQSVLSRLRRFAVIS